MHEPIWHWRDLSSQHADVVEAIGWVSPAMKSFVESFDHFPAVFGNGISDYLRIISALGTTGQSP